MCAVAAFVAHIVNVQYLAHIVSGHRYGDVCPVGYAALADHVAAYAAIRLALILLHQFHLAKESSVFIRICLVGDVACDSIAGDAFNGVLGVCDSLGYGGGAAACVAGYIYFAVLPFAPLIFLNAVLLKQLGIYLFANGGDHAVRIHLNGLAGFNGAAAGGCIHIAQLHFIA